MAVAIFWTAITLCLLSGAAKSNTAASEESCMYLVPSYATNFSNIIFNSTILDDIGIDSEYIRANFTAIRTSLVIICEELFTDNADIVVGDVNNCSRGLLRDTTDTGTYGILGNETYTVTSGLLYSAATVTLTDDTNTESTSSIVDVNTAVVKRNRATTTARNNGPVPTITYEHLKDVCPKIKDARDKPEPRDIPKPPAYWQQDVSSWINKKRLKVVAALGLPGNTLAFITILRMKPVTSSALIIAVLAFSDTYVLIGRIVYDELNVKTNILSSAVCGFLRSTVVSMRMFSSWLVVIMTLERVVAVWFPFRAKTLCTKNKATIAIVVTLLIILGLNSWRLFAYQQISGYCIFQPEYYKFKKTIWYWVRELATAIIPICFLLFSNGAIIIGMRRSQALQRNMNVREEDMKKNIAAQRQVTIMSLVVSITFLILLGPRAVYMLHSNVSNARPSTILGMVNYYLVQACVLLLMDMNNAVNFYLYFLSGRKFRVQLSKMFRCYNKAKASTTRDSLATPTCVPMVSIPDNMVV